MAVRSNRYYHDPNFGAIASNIASIFAPPSAQDMASAAVAQATREKAQRLAQLFAEADSFDKRNIAAGNYAPTQSYYAVDTNNATTRRGQDVVARTSIYNNDQDNARALQEREMIEAAATGRNNADNTRATITSMFGPLNPGQVRPELPADVAGIVGLPALPSVAGAPKPLSLDEIKGAAFGQLPLATQQNATLAGSGTVNVVRDGRTVVETNAGAVGAEPYINPGATAKPTNAVAVTPAGERIPAVQDLSTGRWKHAQTGAELPPDIQIMDLPRLQGSATDVGGATVANQTQATNQEAEITRALTLLDIYENLVDNKPGSIGLSGLIRGTVQNAGATAADLAKSFNRQAPEVAEAATAIQQGLQKLEPGLFDTSIPEADFLQGTLAYALARTENPSGEVSRQAYERALERVKGGGLLANSLSAKAAIGTNRQVLQSQLQGLRVLRNPGTGRTDTGFRNPNADTNTPPPNTNDPVAKARAAIQAGAPREAVIQRLRDNGIDPAGL